MAKAREIPECGNAAATEGARLVLQIRLEEFLSFREAALDWSDAEGVHDMRVASRRLRTAAADFRGLLPKSRLRRLRRGVKELADALGEVRDADVAIAALEEIARDAPPELAAGLESFTADRRARREQARERLRADLEAERVERLAADFFALLAPGGDPDKRDDTSSDNAADETPSENAAETSSENVGDETPSDSDAPAADSDPRAGDREARGADSGAAGTDEDHAGSHVEAAEARPEVSDLTFADAGRRIVGRRLRDFAAGAAASIFRPLDAEGLHDLRIEAKALRYALELFSACLGDDLKSHAKEIARLQSSLGALHDCDVWINDLGRRLKAKGEADDAAKVLERAAPPSPERRAALWLLRHFAAGRARHYADALARWHAWENHNILARLRRRVSDPATPAD